MEQDQNTQTTQANPPSSMVSEANSATALMNNGGQSASLESLMAQSPKLCPLSGWLTCLRRPALSMQYSLQKRHVPDLDADTGSRNPTASAPGKGSGSSPSPAAGKPGQNSDTMDVTGGFTIRYFDFAMGVLGLSLLACILKGCSCLKRRIF